MRARRLYFMGGLSLLAIGFVGGVSFLQPGLALPPPKTSQQVSQSLQVTQQVLVILDVSGSMSDALPSGETKMQAAREAIAVLAKEIPNTLAVGLRVYSGQNTLGLVGDCSNTRSLLAIKAGNAQLMPPLVAGLQPNGPTPISHTLSVAVKTDFPYNHLPKRIVLISDGEETCSTDPCPVVLELLRKNKGLKIDVIALGSVGAAAQRQLKCVALGTYGKLVSASDSKVLATQLVSLVKGTKRVQATLVPNQGSSSSTPKHTTPKLTELK